MMTSLHQMQYQRYSRFNREAKNDYVFLSMGPRGYEFIDEEGSLTEAQATDVAQRLAQEHGCDVAFAVYSGKVSVKRCEVCDDPLLDDGGCRFGPHQQ